MHRYVGVQAASLIIALISFLSFASGQTVNVEMPTGDVWPPREELIYIPPAATVPSTLDDLIMPWENAVPPSDAIPFEAKRTTSNHESNKIARSASIRSRKNCTPRHGRLADAATYRNCTQKRRRAPYPVGAQNHRD